MKRAPAPPRTGTVGVLLIGHSDPDRDVLEAAVEGQGGRFARAATADDALTLLRTGDWALVFIDQGGEETARHIRRESAQDGLPIVFLCPAEPDQAEFLGVAPAGYLVRPLDPAALQLKIESSLAMHRATAAAVTDLARLQAFSVRLSGAGTAQQIHDELLKEVLHVQDARMGMLEVPDEQGGLLRVGSSSGHREGAAVKLGPVPIREGQGACGTAAFRRARVMVEDVDRDPITKPFRGFAEWAGYRSVWSVPVLGRDGALLAVLSTHDPVAKLPTPRQIRLVELYATQAGFLLENLRLIGRVQKSDLAKFRLAAIVESSDDAIVSKTLEGIVTSWNAGARRVFGYEEAEILGRSITLLIPEDRLAEERMILDKIGRGESVKHYETVRRRKDGRLIDMSITVSPVRDADGRIVGASKIARDITAEKRVREEVQRLNSVLEERVRERTASLEEMVRELNTFAYTVAHDLRAPLRAIHGFGQMLHEDYAGRLDAAGRGYIDQLVGGAERMDVLIRDLLEYSRISREQVRVESVDLDAVVAAVLLQMKADLTERKAEVRVDAPLHRVLGHSVSLGQALCNLVSNAAKFVPAGRVPKIHIRSDRQGGRVRLWVEDNGLGIDREHHQRIFKLFERLHAREAFPGTGIGLAIVGRAVERMGGTVGVESVPGRGSRFFIELPAADAAVLS